MAWTIGNFYLSESQRQANAYEVYLFFSGRGWTLNAIAGMLGNMESESNINPGIWQNLDAYNYSLGFGLVQWTPATNYTNWAASNGYEISNPEGQMKWLDEVTVSAGQWIPTSAYDISFDQFKVSMESPEYLASVFLKNFERAGIEVENERRTQARKWYDYLEQFTGYSQIIETAVEWALSIANDDSHGYDQANRDGPDYDCSSLVCWAYYIAGLNTRPGYTPATYTMYQVFIAAGFSDATGSVNLSTGDGLQRGDVLLSVQHHTAIYIGDGQIVQASINEQGETVGGITGDQTGREIWTRSYYNYPWDYVLRYPGGGSVTPPEPEEVYIVRFIQA